MKQKTPMHHILHTFPHHYFHTKSGILSPLHQGGAENKKLRSIDY